MRISHRPRSSRLWEVIYRVFPRRASGHRQSQESLPTESDISEHTDGFYLYSQSLIEEEAEKLAALKLQASQSTEEMSFASAVSIALSLAYPNTIWLDRWSTCQATANWTKKMEPYRGPTRPYTIGDVDWVLPSPSPINNIIDGESGDAIISVLAVLSKVYSIAKVLTAVLLSYGVEV